MDSPAFLRHQCASRLSYGERDGSQHDGVRDECYSSYREDSILRRRGRGVDIAKTVFQLCVADTKWRRLEKLRLSRSQFERWFDNRDVALVVMEACGMAHHWSRWLAKRGVEAIMLPAH
jgi:hypothetical protein